MNMITFYCHFSLVINKAVCGLVPYSLSYQLDEATKNVFGQFSAKKHLC